MQKVSSSLCELFLAPPKRGHLIYCSARIQRSRNRRLFQKLSLSTKPEDTRRRNIKGWKKIYPADFLSQFHRRRCPQSETDQKKKNRTERSSDLFWKFLISYGVTGKFLPIQQKFRQSTTYHNGRTGSEFQRNAVALGHYMNFVAESPWSTFNRPPSEESFGLRMKNKDLKMSQAVEVKYRKARFWCCCSSIFLSCSEMVQR